MIFSDKNGGTRETIFLYYNPYGKSSLHSFVDKQLVQLMHMFVILLTMELIVFSGVLKCQHF